MNNECPTSVNVVSWFFIIIGCLGAVSAIGYIVVVNINDGAVSKTWSVFIQIVIACALIFLGTALLRGSEKARRLLEFVSFLLLALFIWKGVDLYVIFDNWWAALSVSIYLIPIFFIIRALKSKKIKTYTAKKI